MIFKLGEDLYIWKIWVGGILTHLKTPVNIHVAVLLRGLVLRVEVGSGEDGSKLLEITVNLF